MILSEEKKLDTLQDVPNCLKTPNPKFYFKILFINLVQGIIHFFYLTFLKDAPEVKMCSLVCFKTKNEGSQKIYFSLDQVKNKLAHFRGLKLKLKKN